MEQRVPDYRQQVAANVDFAPVFPRNAPLSPTREAFHHGHASSVTFAPNYAPFYPGGPEGTVQVSLRDVAEIKADIAAIEQDLADRDGRRIGRKRGSTMALRDPYQMHHHELNDYKFESEALQVKLPALKNELAAALRLKRFDAHRARHNAAQSMIAAAAQERPRTQHVDYYHRSYSDYAGHGYR